MPARTLLLACCVMVAPLAHSQPTFYKDVLPVLQKHCQDCHRPGEVAPMALLTYSQTRPWAKAIKAAVLAKKMPPWSPDPHFGKFSNDVSLQAGEIALLTSWADSGAREGDAADAPKPRQFADGWHMPKPEVVFELPHGVHVPATGAVDYMFFSVPTGFTEDKWVEMVEVRPTNRAVVHHAIVYVQTPDGWSGDFLAGYAPGAVPQMWKPGQARLVKAGSTLMFQMHYTTNGKPALDRTRLGLVFAKKPPVEQIVALKAFNPRLEIPPGVADYRVDAFRTLPRSVSLVSLRPHMHMRGKSFDFRVVYPDGRTEVLLNVPKYDFNWQPYYYLETPLQLPRGARIECTAHFDNSANNPFNPNPKATVGWGEQTWDEMMIGWFDVAVPVRSEMTRTPGPPRFTISALN